MTVFRSALLGVVLCTLVACVSKTANSNKERQPQSSGGVTIGSGGVNAKIFCGERFGTTGNVYLQGTQTVILAEQGGDQQLADQADNLVDGGMQVGQRYCIESSVDEKGQPRQVLAAAVSRLQCGTWIKGGGLQGRHGQSVGIMSLGERPLIEEAVEIYSRDSGGKNLRAGSHYCAEVAIIHGVPAKILKVFEDR